MSIPNFESSDTDQGFQYRETTTRIYGDRHDEKNDALLSCKESLYSRYIELAGKGLESLSSEDKALLELLKQWVSTKQI